MECISDIQKYDIMEIKTLVEPLTIQLITALTGERLELVYNEHSTDINRYNFSKYVGKISLHDARFCLNHGLVITPKLNSTTEFIISEDLIPVGTKLFYNDLELLSLGNIPISAWADTGNQVIIKVIFSQDRGLDGYNCPEDERVGFELEDLYIEAFDLYVKSCGYVSMQFESIFYVKKEDVPITWRLWDDVWFPPDFFTDW